MKVAIHPCFIFLFFSLVFGCAKDRTGESWQNEKVSGKSAQISATTLLETRSQVTDTSVMRLKAQLELDNLRILSIVRC